MNILYHHRTRALGAEGTHILGMVRAFTKLGNSVTIVEPPGVNVKECYDADNLKSSSRTASLLAYLLSRVPGVVFELQEVLYNFYILPVLFWRSRHKAFIYERYSLFLFAGVLLSKLSRIPIVLEVNDSALVERVRPLYMKRLARLFEKHIFGSATCIVFISGQFRKIAEDAYGKLPYTLVTPNAVDPDWVNDSPSGMPVSTDLIERTKYRVVCGYVGSFARWHGIHEFVKHAAQYMPQHPEILYLFVGDGALYPDVMQIVDQYGLHDQVQLIGRIPHSALPNYLKLMDVAILPDSNVYGSPMKILEYMAFGIPVIAPDYPPIREVIKDGVNGWLFPRKRYDDCLRILQRVASSRKKLNRAGRCAKEYILNNRTWLHNAESVIRALDSIVKE